MTPFAQARTLAELRFATRVFMRRHRTLPWRPAEPTRVPEWLRRGIPKDLSRSAL